MRRRDREVSEKEAIRIYDEADYMTLACIAEDGTPYCVPLSSVRKGKCIYFHCAKEGKKIDALRHASRVCVNAVSHSESSQQEFTTYYASCILYGTCNEVTEEEEKIEALRSLAVRYNPQIMEGFEEELHKFWKVTAVYRIDIDEISGKSNMK